jgi:hypothetical protein
MVKKIDAGELEDLKNLFERLQLREAELDAARATFQLMMTKLFVKHHLNARTHAVCLLCGKFNLQSQACQCQAP